VNALPEISEPAATGQVRRLYADIREVMGVPLVNLVYRHLATEPAALDWAWGAVRPHFRSGALHAQASTLRRTVATMVDGWGLPLPARSWPDEVTAVTGAYSMGNSLNLLAMTALLRDASEPQEARAETDAHAERAATEPAGRSMPSVALPALPSLKELPVELQARIHRLNRFAESCEPKIIASLYRHLAVWPAFLLEVEALLAPLQEGGTLMRARDETVAAAVAIAKREALPVPRPVAEFEQFRPQLEQLVRITIPKMIPVSVLLQRLPAFQA
jgi:hypothetical protein